eukprot:CAMPEP_0178928982 /NCGR_PEP_ID=MMETSP0786-20121207/20268_1 /TAXON_ID=186022 /ORGANISM="Thalassionema frauenfeldii, Strain CCMP 1798" /LENGTH=147 /DNA_ID=CAMNT_0020605031 /DNA_START=385 /DNA_END=828 /DNA_ORIENTATION=+
MHGSEGDTDIEGELVIGDGVGIGVRSPMPGGDGPEPSVGKSFVGVAVGINLPGGSCPVGWGVKNWGGAMEGSCVLEGTVSGELDGSEPGFSGLIWHPSESFSSMINSLLSHKPTYGGTLGPSALNNTALKHLLTVPSVLLYGATGHV